MSMLPKHVHSWINSIDANLTNITAKLQPNRFLLCQCDVTREFIYFSLAVDTISTSCYSIAVDIRAIVLR